MRNKDFRPIYYLGCKSSFAERIKDAIDDVDPTGGHVCDLFSGTGVISACLSMHRPVTAIDIQEYSRVLCSAQLSSSRMSNSEAQQIVELVANSQVRSKLLDCLAPLIKFETESIVSAVKGHPLNLIALLEAKPLYCHVGGIVSSGNVELDIATKLSVKNLKAADLLESSDTIVSRMFGGVYFSFSQAATLDSILSESARHSGGIKDIILASALSTASQIVNTVGKQFAQPIQPRSRSGEIKNKLGQMVERDRFHEALNAFSIWLHAYASIPKPSHNATAIRANYVDGLAALASELSVIYADPPYTRDHYSRFYHVLETMCLRDNPSISLVTKNGAKSVSRGIYREGRHQSPFCIRSTAPQAFERLFSIAKTKRVPLVLSYSPHESGDGTHPRVVSASQILELARKQFRHVDLESIEGSAHNQLNRIGLQLKQREHAEVIIKCRH